MDAPTVEMLWAEDDPEVVLRERFGHADPAALAAWLQTVLAREYDLAVTACTRVVMSDQSAIAWVSTAARSGREVGSYVVKWCVDPTRFEKLERLGDVTDRLASRGIAVSPHVPASDGVRQTRIDGVALFVQHEIDGDLLNVDDLDEVHAVGVEVARLHLALADLPESDLIAPTVTQAWSDGVRAWAVRQPEQVPRPVRTAILTSLPEGTREPPSQLLHGDLRAANILCHDARVAAILDFEEARRGPVVDELARAAVMLGTRYREWAPVSPRVHAVLRSGYESIRPLDDVEDAWWRVLVLLYSAAFIPAGVDPQGWGAAALHLVRTWQDDAD